VEDFRQKSPSDAVAVANMLLEARAEVDALADIYGKSTTLGLVATSIHPRRAGVQIALMETLLEHGAAMDGIVVPALHNGRKEAAEFLARRGAKLDLEGAAGVGRLDLVQQFVEQGATKAAMELGFLWACEYGRTDVVEYLLAKGVDIDTQANTGMTGLHWAIVGGDLEIIKLLVARGARLDILNRYGGTALGQALWSAEHGESDSDYQSVINLLLGHGANS
jgi:ankyrin repeat protein